MSVMKFYQWERSFIVGNHAYEYQKMAVDGWPNVYEERNIETSAQARVVGQVRTAMRPIPSEVPYT